MIVTSLSILLNISLLLREQDRNNLFVESIFLYSDDTKIRLDLLLEYLENSNIESAKVVLQLVSSSLLQLDASLRTFDRDFIGFPSFSLLASTLTDEFSQLIGSEFNSILIDDYISESEILFLMQLRNSLEILFYDFSMPSNGGRKPNDNLTNRHIRKIIDDFWSNWK